MKDKQISEEELLEELDTMYQRVADIEKEEAAQAPTTVPRTKPKQKKKKTFRNILVAIFIFFVALASILAITVFDPVTLFQRLRTGTTQPSPVVPPRSPSKNPAAVPSTATPKLPAAAATSPGPQKPQTVATSSPASPPPPAATPPAATAAASATRSLTPPKPASELPPVQAKREALKSPPQGMEKPKPITQETMQPNKPLPRGKYFAIQVGAFRDMENVRELVETFKKEGLDAYWIPMEDGSRGTLYRVFVGRFTNIDEAAEVLKDKKIFKNYPDSFIKAAPSSKMNRQ
ncbi:MAG TPA: SPOR domain-containing protein [Thermodesulfobacteriota bacterium]|nr:SPOR domain-containing protein [Thermodesulfobacteriota bacterium]